MSRRIEMLRAGLEEPLLVTDRVNLRYLVGFDSSNGALLVEPDRLTLYSDFRYAAAGQAIPGVEFVETRRALLADLAGRLQGRISFEADSVSYAGYEALSAGGGELVPRRGLVEALRAVKDETEVDCMRRAAAIATRALERLVDQPLAGSTERELAWRLELLMREAGAEGLAFEIGLGSGPNGANPHADYGDRVVQSGDAVVVDFGARVGAYCSDCTRTFAVGHVPEWLERAYSACLEAQLAGLGAVAPGVAGVAVDRAARGVIERAGFGDAFGHGLGHGIGMLVHEAPALRPESTDTLETGNAVTVEPGIYLEGLGGVRIEDLVVVRDQGAEVLTLFTKELLTVG